MKKQNRIKRAEEFQSLIEKKRSDLNKNFVIYHQPKVEESARVGITVGKKFGNAVLRNKTKRQIRMMVQEVLNNNYSFDCIIIVRFKYFKDDYATNLNQLEKLFIQIEKRRYTNESI